MMIRVLRSRSLLAALAVALLAPNAAAQAPLPIHLQAGYSFDLPSGDFAATDGTITDMPNTGFALSGHGFRIRGILQFTEPLALFAEIHRPRFSVDVAAVKDQLEVPDYFTYDAQWQFKMTTIGLRYSPLNVAFTKPYVLAGISQNKIRIVQTVSNRDRSMNSDLSTGMTFGGGVMAFSGPFALDATAQYHRMTMSFEGSKLGWKTTWLEVGILFSYRLGG
jgi:hypothetical protein